MFAQTDHIRRRGSRPCVHHALAYTPPLLIPHVLNAQRTRLLLHLDRWLVSVHNAVLDMEFVMAINAVLVMLARFQLKEIRALHVHLEQLLHRDPLHAIIALLDITMI